jgi:hypothetical protein
LSQPAIDWISACWTLGALLKQRRRGDGFLVVRNHLGQVVEFALRPIPAMDMVLAPAPMLPGIELGPVGFKNVDGPLLHAASVRAPTRIVGNNGRIHRSLTSASRPLRLQLSCAPTGAVTALLR